MSQAAYRTQTETKRSRDAADDAPAAGRERSGRAEPSPIVQALKLLASLKLTVALFGLATFLVFYGTLAQIEGGIWDVVSNVFRAWFTFISFEVLSFHLIDTDLGVFFPGGWIIGGLMLVNLLAAHALRFRVKASGGRLVIGLLALGFGVGMTGIVLAGTLQPDVAATEGAAFWRVLWRLCSAGIAAVVLLGACYVLFAKRAGIVLLHAGVIMLLANELIIATVQEEGQMRLREGQSLSYANDIRKAELAIIDPSNEQYDDVVVVPEAKLRQLGDQQRLRHDDLPFDLRVVRFMANHELFRTTGGGENKATAGHGLSAVAREADVASGASANQSVDLDAAYIELFDKATGDPIGTYLFSVLLDFQNMREAIEVGGKAYIVTLRFHRTYKPYTIKLIDFKHEKYLGTDKPKDFSSYVQLVDPEDGVDRQVRIWMNNPLRYKGDTLYQSSFDPTDDKVTVLQVVDNAGWMIPYVACMIVAAGMIGHMAPMLTTFLMRRLTA